MSTMKELREVAAQKGIKGRWEMTKAQLEAAVAGGKGRVIRKGRNLSGNKPYVAKIYRCGRVVHTEELANEPRQVQSIVQFMAESKIEGRGEDIIRAAVKAKALKTRIKDPRELFGYYAKRLQNYGVTSQYAA